jgi:hypothetical protein
MIKPTRQINPHNDARAVMSSFRHWLRIRAKTAACRRQLAGTAGRAPESACSYRFSSGLASGPPSDLRRQDSVGHSGPAAWVTGSVSPVHTESRGDSEHPSDQVILNHSCPERWHGQDSLRSGMFP